MEGNNSSPIANVVDNGILKITLNRPGKKNAITLEMYTELGNLLLDSSNNDGIRMMVMTGNGDYFSSGNDMNFISDGDVCEQLQDKSLAFKRFVDHLVTYPKLTVALVNGPAIGIAATMLGIFDIVYASETAYFQTPFSKLGLVAEGCSTYTFPKILGPSKAGEMLYLGYKMDAYEAKRYGLISEIYTHDRFGEVWERLYKVSSLSLESIQATKRLVKKWNKERLLDANASEVAELQKLWESPESIERFLQFASQGSKI